MTIGMEISHFKVLEVWRITICTVRYATAGRRTYPQEEKNILAVVGYGFAASEVSAASVKDKSSVQNAAKINQRLISHPKLFFSTMKNSKKRLAMTPI